MSLLRRYLASLRRFGIPGSGGAIVVAYSGGPDSTALLHLTLRALSPSTRVVAAHLDHALRPESSREAVSARETAEALGAESRVRRVDVPAAAAALRLSVEAAARRLRYEFLEETARREGAPFVLTGHHADDQAETVLMRLLRGAGPSGLAGIAESRPVLPSSPVRLLRPLLAVGRDELRGYLDRRRLDFLTDPTNSDGGNLRSRIRTDLLPLLGSRVPDLPGRLRKLGLLSDRLRREWSALARRHVRLTRRASGVRCSTDVPPGLLRERLRTVLPPGAPVIDRRALRRLGLARRRGRGVVEIGRGWAIRVSEEGRRLGAVPPSSEAKNGSLRDLDLPLPCPGEVLLPCGTRIRAAMAAGAAYPAGPASEIIDPGDGSLRVRYAKRGDRFRPLGFTASTTVHRFLMAHGVPREERARTPVVTGKSGLLWVVGHRISEAAKVRAGSEHLVLLAASRT